MKRSASSRVPNSQFTVEMLEPRLYLSGDLYEDDNTAASAGSICVSGLAQTSSIHVTTGADQVGAAGDLSSALQSPATQVAAKRKFGAAATSLAHTTAKLSVARTGSVAVTVGTKTLFAGGSDSSYAVPKDAVDIYDSVSGKWTTARLSQARLQFSAAVLGTRVFFAGGCVLAKTGELVPTRVVDIYDSKTNTWSTAKLSVARDELAATSVGTKVFFAGGTSNQTVSNIIDVFDKATGKWTIMKLSQARRGLTALTVGTKALFAGGQASSGVSSTVDIYDNQTGKWSVSKLSKARGGWTAAVSGTKAVFAGGYVQNTVGMNNSTNVVDIYDSATGKWATAKLSQGRYGLTATTVGARLVFAGGSSKVTTPVPGGWNSVTSQSNTVDVFDTATGTWTTAKLPKQSGSLVAAGFGTKVAFCGGEEVVDVGQGSTLHQEFSPLMDIYDLATGKWSSSTLSKVRIELTAATVGNKAIFAGGQYYPAVTCSNVVDIFA